MSVTGGEGGSRDQNSELTELIRMLEVLVSSLQALVRSNEDSNMRGPTRTYLTAVLLPEVQQVLMNCSQSLAIRVALNYAQSRQQDSELGKPQTRLKIRDELPPLLQVLEALHIEEERRAAGGPTDSSSAPRSSGAPRDWSGGPSDPGRPRYRGVHKAPSDEVDGIGAERIGRRGIFSRVT